MDLRTRRLIGAGTWGAGLVVATVWGLLDGSGSEGVGYGFAPAVNVSSLETAKILELPVQLHDLVTAGQVVVRMDPAPVVDEREVAAANLLAVQEEQVAMAASEARRFAGDVEGTLIDRAKIAADLQEDMAYLETVRERLTLEEDLAATGASSAQAVEEWKREMRVIEARISANRNAMAVANQAASSAKERVGLAPVANQWTVVAATRELEWIEGRISRMDLAAGIDGQVSWIYRTPGEVVPAGEPILQVRRTATREVVAFVAPSEAVGLEAGGSATVRRSTGEVVRGKLVSVGSGPQPLPMQLWKMPNWPEYGIPVRVELESEIAPDESVTVRI